MVLLVLNWIQICVFVFVDVPLIAWHKIPLVVSQFWMLICLITCLLIHVKRTITSQLSPVTVEKVDISIISQASFKDLKSYTLSEPLIINSEKAAPEHQILGISLWSAFLKYTEMHPIRMVFFVSAIFSLSFLAPNLLDKAF